MDCDKHTAKPVMKLYGEYPAARDSAWGCTHMLSMISRYKFLVLQPRLCDFKFYQVKRRLGRLTTTMITIDITEYPWLLPAIQKAEKPLYLCKICISNLFKKLPADQITTLPGYS